MLFSQISRFITRFWVLKNNKHVYCRIQIGSRCQLSTLPFLKNKIERDERLCGCVQKADRAFHSGSGTTASHGEPQKKQWRSPSPQYALHIFPGKKKKKKNKNPMLL